MRPASSRPLLVALLGALLTLTACPPPAAPAAPPAHPAEQWTGTEAKLFDDGIDVGAVPAAPEVEPPRDDSNDPLIGQRLSESDGVFIVKVRGVSREPVGGQLRFKVELIIEGEPLAGHSPGRSLLLFIGPDSPCFGTVRGREAEIVGRKLVMYYRAYAPPKDADGPSFHYHLSGASSGLLADVKKQLELLGNN